MNQRIQTFANFLSDYQTYSFEAFEKELADIDDASEKGMLFEEYCRALLKSDLYRAKNVWRPEELPISIRDNLNTTSKDMGIDFIAEIDDVYHAVQCKFRKNPNMIIDWGCVSTFLAAVFASNKFKGVIFICNTNKAHKMMKQDHIITIMRPTLLEQDIFHLILKEFSIDLELKTDELRKCQIEAIAKFKEYFGDSENQRGRIQMACGSGKSRVSYEVSNDYEVVAILVPSLYLLNQFFKSFTYLDSKDDASKRNFVLVGSDLDYDAVNNNYLISTNEDNIIQKLRLCLKRESKIVIISTYQSSLTLKNALSKIDDFKVNLMIFDEAHRTAGGDVNKAFALLLNDNEEIGVNIERRLFMTATERVLRGADENDETKYGKQIYSFSMGKAIENGVLCDYRIMMPLVDGAIKNDVLKQRYVNVSEKELKEYSADLVMCAVMIKKLFEEGEIKYLLTYHSSVSSAKDFVKLLGYLDFKDAHVLTGDNNIKQRNNTIDHVRKNGGLIASVRVFNEGVDIPFCDSVCFINGRESKIDIIQCIGRCLRLHKDKKIATIILPLLVDDKQKVIEDNNYIYQVIKAVAENDFRIYEEIRTRDKTSKKGIGRLVFKDYTCCGKEESELDLEDYCDKIGLEVLGRLEITGMLSWEQMFELLIRYRDEFNILPKNKEIFKGFSLGSWTIYQRSLYWKKQLKNDKIEKLDSLGSYWSWDVIGDEWKRKYNIFLKFLEKYNKFPDNHDMLDDVDIGNWVYRQKTNEDNISDEYKNLLMKIKGWKFVEKSRLDWNQYYELLKKFKKENKQFPTRHQTQDGFAVGGWFMNQKVYYNNNQLSEEKIKKLNDLEMIWSHNENLWKSRYNILIKFYEQNKKLPIQTDKFEDFIIGAWLQDQIEKYRDNKLDDYKFKLLDKLGVQWNYIEDKWDEGFNILKKYIEENNEEPILSTIYNEYKIGQWLGWQRTRYRAKKLEKDKIDKLNKLSIKWNKKDLDTNWNERYNWLINFMKENNNEFPESKDIYNNFGIGAWLIKQREEYNKNKLNEYKVGKFNKIGMIWDISGNLWMQYYNTLLEYLLKHAKFPKQREVYNNLDIGGWIYRQKKEYKLGKLLKNRIDLLNKVSHWEW